MKPFLCGDSVNPWTISQSIEFADIRMIVYWAISAALGLKDCEIVLTQIRAIIGNDMMAAIRKHLASQARAQAVLAATPFETDGIQFRRPQ